MGARPWLSYVKYFKINYFGDVNDDIDGDVDEEFTTIAEVRSWRSNFVVMVPMVRRTWATLSTHNLLPMESNEIREFFF